MVSVRKLALAAALALRAGGTLVTPAETTGTAGARVEPAVSIGLKDDAVQPLTLRVSQGDCLRIHLHNLLPRGEPVSLHLHGSALRVSGASTGPRPPSRGRIEENLPAVAANPAATAAPGATVVYEWMVAPNEQLGTYYFHSHALERTQTDHGLFGAVVARVAVGAPVTADAPRGAPIPGVFAKARTVSASP